MSRRCRKGVTGNTVLRHQTIQADTERTYAAWASMTDPQRLGGRHRGGLCLTTIPNKESLLDRGELSTKSITTGVLFALLLTAAFGATTHAATYTAPSCNRSDVNAVINGPMHAAINGDTIIIPAGLCTWTGGITVPIGIGITIIGAGTPNSSPSTTGAAASCSHVVITDNSGSSLFRFRPNVGASLSRISCMEVTTGSPSTVTAPFAMAGTCDGTGCPNIRIDNITFDTPAFQGMTHDSGSLVLTDNVFGVVDHNTLTDGSYSKGGIEFISYNNSAWAGVGSYGDNSWSSADTFGTAQTLYLENNAIGATLIVAETEAQVANGGEGGGRIAARFNKCIGCRSGISNHGTESNGRPRGGRQIECYNNIFECTHTGTSCNGAVPIRSGVAIAFGNSIIADAGTWYNHYVSFSVYRNQQNIGGWGACDGAGKYDYNDGVTYWSGTIGTVTGSNPYTITVSGASPGWTTNQWVSGTGTAYSIHDSTINNGSEITANGSNTLTVQAWTSIPFVSGDSIEILRAIACLDQSNRSGGTYLYNFTPEPTNAGPSYVYQTLDPSYEWNDSGYNPVMGNVGGPRAMKANRDWYTDNSVGTPHIQTSATTPFNGTSGVGFGLIKYRPEGCTPQVGYWATDEGSWNQSGSGGQGRLYVCDSTDHWTLYYTPYTYPHPLTVTGTTLNPPTNLRVVPQ